MIAFHNAGSHGLPRRALLWLGLVATTHLAALRHRPARQLLFYVLPKTKRQSTRRSKPRSMLRRRGNHPGGARRV